jgi:glycosyltransferase involved in cell wall biosynthesis
MIDSRYEKNVLKNSDMIITVGPSLKNSFSLKVKGTENKTEIITNGYDERDFEGRKAKTPSTFTITYVGTLSDKYPLDGFLGALDKIRKNNIDFFLRFVGTVPENIRKRIMSKISMDSIEFIPYTYHDKAITFMMNSSMLLLVIPEHRNNINITTGKIFEYIATGKPILCLGPEDGDAAIILTQYGFGKCFSYKDINNIETYILSVISNPGSLQIKREEFSHRNIAKKLVSFLR